MLVTALPHMILVKKMKQTCSNKNFQLRNIFVEGNNEEYIVMKNQYRTKNLTDPYSIRETASKKYVANLFNGPSIKKHKSC